MKKNRADVIDARINKNQPQPSFFRGSVYQNISDPDFQLIFSIKIDNPDYPIKGVKYEKTFRGDCFDNFCNFT